MPTLSILLNQRTAANESSPAPATGETVLVYPDRATEGVLTPLAAELMPIFEYDSLRVHEQRRGSVHRIALQLRQAGKRIFHLKMIRKGGRLLVELSGADAARALRGIRVCRDHFDEWFGITSSEVDRFREGRC